MSKNPASVACRPSELKEQHAMKLSSNAIVILDLVMATIVQAGPDLVPGGLSSHLTENDDLSEVLKYHEDLIDDPIFSEVTEDNNGEEVSTEILFGRNKRGMAQLGKMMKCATGCNPIAYLKYGCYCGYLGSGIPVDGIDSCCKQHDQCYEQTSCKDLQYHLPYFVSYRWKCNYGYPSCIKKDYTSGRTCGDDLCECDIQFAKCLQSYSCADEESVPTCRTPRSNVFQGVLQAIKYEFKSAFNRGQSRPRYHQTRGRSGRFYQR